MRVPSDIEHSRRIEAELADYEGVIFKTTQIVLQAGAETESDDVAQILRLKVWKALRAYDPKRARGLAKRNYVFMCIMDEKKTLLNRKRRYEAHIEDFVLTEDAGAGNGASDKFTQRYLSQDEHETFAEVFNQVEIPTSVTDAERWVLVLMYRDYKQVEIAETLDIPKREVERRVRSIRQKLEGMRPVADDEPEVELAVAA